jgi:FtsZ-binding cell division protein ZapB
MSQEITGLERKLDMAVQHLVTLEQYRQIAKPGLTKQAASIMAVGLKEIAEFMGEPTLGLEAIASTSNAVSIRPSDETDGTLLARLKALVAKFIKWLRELIDRAMTEVAALRADFGKLKERAKEMLTSVVDLKTAEVTIPAALMNRVSIDAVENQGHWPELEEMVEFVIHTYPEAVTEFYSEVAGILNTTDLKQDTSGLATAMSNATQPMKIDGIDKTIYPGNVMITSIADGFSYRVAPHESNQFSEAVTRNTRDETELRTALNEIISLSTEMESIKDANTKVKAAVDKAMEALEKLQARAENGTPEEIENANNLVTTVLDSISKVKTGDASIIRYVDNVIKAHLTLIENEIKAATAEKE